MFQFFRLNIKLNFLLFVNLYCRPTHMNMNIIQHKTGIRSLPKERFGFVWETKELFNLFHVSLFNV